MTENLVPILLITLTIVLIVILFIVVSYIYMRLKSLERRQGEHVVAPPPKKGRRLRAFAARRSGMLLRTRQASGGY